MEKYVKNGAIHKIIQSCDDEPIINDMSNPETNNDR